VIRRFPPQPGDGPYGVFCGACVALEPSAAEWMAPPRRIAANIAKLPELSATKRN